MLEGRRPQGRIRTLCSPREINTRHDEIKSHDRFAACQERRREEKGAGQIRIKGMDPNIWCPAEFYCLNGTKMSDPFRNDTILRPYACSPGTFCVAGTGSNVVHEGTVGFAQP